jgi:hypothetical protein
MNEYRKILLLLKDSLNKSKNYHWEKWIDQDIYDWDNLKSTKHHKSAFGGMGSINDLLVGDSGKIGTWKNNMFDYLKSLSSAFAATNEIHFLNIKTSTIQGVICENCNYAEISEGGIESYISKKHIPFLVKKLLPTDKYSMLSNIENLINEPDITNDRNKLIYSLKDLNIKLNNNIVWSSPCTKCTKEDKCVYRWDVNETNGTIFLTASENNLSLKNSEVEMSWWKKLLGYC